MLEFANGQSRRARRAQYDVHMRLHHRGKIRVAHHNGKGEKLMLVGYFLY